jgi:hypothetical protein
MRASYDTNSSVLEKLFIINLPERNKGKKVQTIGNKTQITTV